MTQPCVSLATGTLRPDQRVNYTRGMVLDVADFLTEQQHRLQLPALHERALHGYGTVWGLAVTADRPADAAGEVQLSVSTGAGVDKSGKEFVVTCTQCARVGAWLAAQEQARPGTIATQRQADGSVTIFVVARYASCEDELVPLPSSPCAGSGESSAPSRIRDAWDIDLTFMRPAMARWDTDRRLARLLAAVDIVVGLDPAASSEAAVIAAVEALPDKVADGPDALDPVLPAGGYQLPAETAAGALDRILTAWVTKVRPQLADDLSLPADTVPPDHSILLATLHATPAAQFDPAHPEVTDFTPPDDSGRPYLVHTGLLQELRDLRQSSGVVVKPQEFVTLDAWLDDKDLLHLIAWFHTDGKVALPEVITVTPEGGQPAGFTTKAVGAARHVWTLTPPDGFKTTGGQLLAAAFPGDTVNVTVGGSTSTLADLQANGLQLVNADPPGTVTGYAVVARRAPAAQVPVAPEPQASVHFTTVDALPQDPVGGLIEVWFHPQPDDDAEKVTILEPAVRFADQPSGQDVPISDVRQSPVDPNVWIFTLKGPEHEFPLHLRFEVDAKKTILDAGGTKLRLAEWIKQQQLLFVGWRPESVSIVDYVRVHGFGVQ